MYRDGHQVDGWFCFYLFIWAKTFLVLWTWINSPFSELLYYLMYDADIMHHLKKYQVLYKKTESNKCFLEVYFQPCLFFKGTRLSHISILVYITACLSPTEWYSALLSSTGSRLASPQLFLFSCRPWLWPDSTTYSLWPQRPSFI